MTGYEVNNLVKVSILINGEPVDALSLIVHRDRSQSRGRTLCSRLKDLIPRQQFKVAIQAAIGGKIIARETVVYFLLEKMLRKIKNYMVVMLQERINC